MKVMLMVLTICTLMLVSACSGDPPEPTPVIVREAPPGLHNAISELCQFTYQEVQWLVGGIEAGKSTSKDVPDYRAERLDALQDTFTFCLNWGPAAR